MGELRKDPILGRWVIIATERSKRPGAFHPKNIEGTQTDLEKCPFCAGHEKMTPPEIYSVRHNSSKPNTPGWEVRVVPNKFPALGIDTEIIRRGEGMYDMMSNFGAHEVVIETPNHTREAASR